MDLRQLSYFTALFEEGSVTRAARRVNVVQPALSMQIAKLEREFGQLLFERRPKAMVPTPLGRAFYKMVRPILDEIAETRGAMARLAEGASGRVTAGILSSLTMSVGPDVLLRFASRHPDVELSLADGYSHSFVEQVAEGTLDLAVVNKPERRLGLRTDDLLDEEMVVVAGRSTALPLAIPIRTRDLARLDLILPSPRHGLRRELDRRLAAEDVILTPKLELDLTPAIADILGRSTLFAVLPLLATSRQVADGSLRAYRIVAPRIARQLVLVSRRDVPLSPAARDFIDILAEELTTAARSLRAHVVGDGPPGDGAADARDQSSLFDTMPEDR